MGYINALFISEILYIYSFVLALELWCVVISFHPVCSCSECLCGLGSIVIQLWGVCAANWCSFPAVPWKWVTCMSILVPFIFKLFLLILCTWYFSNLLKCFPFLRVLIAFSVFVIVASPLVYMRFKHTELLLLFLVVCTRSLYLVWKALLFFLILPGSVNSLFGRCNFDCICLSVDVVLLHTVLCSALYVFINSNIKCYMKLIRLKNVGKWQKKIKWSQLYDQYSNTETCYEY
jgi:hypothetical protein